MLYACVWCAVLTYSTESHGENQDGSCDGTEQTTHHEFVHVALRAPVSEEDGERVEHVNPGGSGGEVLEGE